MDSKDWLIAYYVEAKKLAAKMIPRRAAPPNATLFYKVRKKSEKTNYPVQVLTCRVCGYETNRAYNMHKHLRTHTRTTLFNRPIMKHEVENRIMWR